MEVGAPCQGCTHPAFPEAGARGGRGGRLGRGRRQVHLGFGRFLEQFAQLRDQPLAGVLEVDGRGVFETMATLCRYVLRDLLHRLESGSF